MPPRPTIPADDLYARLEVPVDASFEAIELAWRALLRQHHPDVAGLDGLELAKRINVAHDWLGDPGLRERYDRERHHRHTSPPATSAPPGRAMPTRRRRARPVDAAEALARFLDRVARLTADELDRLDCAAPAPIAFVATVRRFLSPERLASVEAAEAAVHERLASATWAHPAAREAVLSYAHELVLGDFLDELLTEPFRGRVRERLTRGWDAAVGQPRHGPNGREVDALLRRLASLDPADVRALASTADPLDPPHDPWPAGTDPEDDEALRVSSVMAARDASTVIPPAGVTRAELARACRAAARIAHLLVLRHAFGASEFSRLTERWRPLVADPRRRSSPHVARR
jgi:hypothetical protein